MEEFYLREPGPLGGTVVLRGTEAHHISRVLRHGVGDRVHATDGLGVEYELELREVGPNRVVGIVTGRCESRREAACRLTIAQGIIKGGRLARVVEDVTQLGVQGVIPLKTKRVVAGLSQARLERLRKVAVEAMKSSTRTVLPTIAEPMSLEEIARLVPSFGFAAVAYEKEADSGLADVMVAEADSVLLIVGPEGGFEPDEIGILEGAGARSFSLGPRRLRAETAAATVVALALQLLGELGGRVLTATERRCS